MTTSDRFDNLYRHFINQIVLFPCKGEIEYIMWYFTIIFENPFNNNN